MKLESEDISCEVNPRGAYVEWVKFRNNEIIKTSGDGHKTHGGIAPLFPYANRIKDGSYFFEGKEYSFDKEKDGNSIHGYAKDMQWDIVENDESSVTMQTDLYRDGQYPFRVRCTIHICISGSRFCEVAHFHNYGDQPAPLSPGFHPYFAVGNEWTVSLEKRALKSIKMDEYFPSGNYLEFYRNIRKKKAGHFDDLFKYSGHIKILGEKYTYEMDTTNSKYMMIYDGEYSEGRSVAVEPMSSPVNAFKSGEDLKMLNPEEIWPFGFSFTVSENSL